MKKMFLGLKKNMIFCYKSKSYQMIMRIYLKEIGLKQSMGLTQVIESTVQHHLAPFSCLSLRGGIIIKKREKEARRAENANARAYSALVLDAHQVFSALILDAHQLLDTVVNNI